MSWAEKNVYGSETFYRGPIFRSAFFVADSIMLFLASAMVLYILIHYIGVLSGPGLLRLFAALVGMWLLWWKAIASHQQIRALYPSNPFPEGEGTNKSLLEATVRTTASLTHLGMFTTFLLVAMLLMQIDETLRQVAHP